MAFLGCFHVWGFPRRWAIFKSQHDVDVQTCVRCGARRTSPVQFGLTPDVQGQAPPSAPQGQREEAW